jgi:hypothetical protein
VPWIQALIWAFKPTNVIDIRYLPDEERQETAAMITRLRGAAPPVSVSPEAGPEKGPQP